MGQLQAALGAGRVGLLVVDMARALADPDVDGHVPAGPPAAEHCRSVLDAARAVGLPVWFSRGGKRWHTSSASPLAEVERGAWLRKNGWVEESAERAPLAMEITPQLQPRPGEIVITKSKPSAFFATPLISQLVAAKADTLVVVGMMTSGCIRATVTDAFSYDLDVVMPVECLADRDAAAHDANLDDMGRKYATLCSTSELVGHLDEALTTETGMVHQ